MNAILERLASLSPKQREVFEIYLRDKGVDLWALPVPPRADRAAPAPLSFSQQRLWFLMQLEPDSPAYNLPFGVRLKGRLDVAAMARSLNEIAHRQEVLRTVFRAPAGEPEQVALPEGTVDLPAVDLADLPAALRQREIERLAVENAQLPFDLASGRLLRVLLLRLAGEDHTQDHAMLAAMHHIVSDGWSMGILIRELAALYEAFSTGAPSPLPELPVQYADYASWQRKWLPGPTLERQSAYWRRQLAGAPAVLALPTDRPRPKALGLAGGSEALALPEELSARLKELGKSEGATLFLTLLAAFNALLFRHTGQDDIVLGLPIANRSREEVQGLIGFFVNTQVLRTDLAGDPGFAELLQRVRERFLEAQAHQDLPFEKLIEELAPERTLAYTPLFQVMFVLQNAPLGTLRLPGLTLEPLVIESGTAKFDLEMMLVETENGLVGMLEYNRELFDATTMRRLVGHFSTLLAAVAADPRRRLSELPVLGETERHQLLLEWVDSSTPWPRDACMPSLFEAQARLTPDAPAVRFEGESLSYRELNARANRLARVLMARGVGPEKLVGLLADRHPDFLTAVLAVFKAGGAYLPLDPHHPTARQRQVLAQSRAALVLADEGFAGDLVEALADSAAPVLVPVLPLAALLDYGESAEDLPTRCGPANLAYVIYTSGSTGVPKGAMLEHRGMLNHLWAKVFDLGLTGRCAVAQTASQCFDISVWQLLAPLLVGGCVHIAADEVAHDPGELLAFLERERITVLEVVPSLLRSMLDIALAGEGARPELTSLGWLLVTGEAFPPDLCRRWFELAPHVPVMNAYGPTECSDDVTHHVIRQAVAVPDFQVPIGRSLGNLRNRVLDRDLNPVPRGAAGELCVAGIGVGRGYFDNPTRTAEVFVPDPFAEEPGDRLYRTGDLVRHTAAGALEFLGRIDHQVKVRGFRIELGEIEARLLEHPAVRQAAVLVREDRPGDKRLAAYLAAFPLPAADELRAFLKERLPEYMVPAAFVVLEALPVTANGKLDRKALPAPEWVFEGTYVAPRTPTEEVLAGIWSEILGVERVGARDNFFEIGGHSLLGTRVMSRIREAFRVELPLRRLFEGPVLAELADSLEREIRSGSGPLAPPILPVPRDQPLPLSFAQQRLWFIEQLDPGDPAYNIPMPLGAEGDLDVAVLRGALSEVVRRHEVLRTRFLEVDGQPVQRIDPPAPVELPVVDLAALPPVAREAEGRRLEREEAWRAFDLARGPLLRSVLLRLSPRSWVALFTQHHIVSDGWSTGLLVREVSALYRALAQGEAPRLPELPVQYADFAAWQRAWLSGAMLEAEIGYWRERLAGAPPALELPHDRPRTGARSSRGAVREVELPGELLARLQALGRRTSATLFMTLLAAFQVLLSRYARQEDVSVGTPIAGRNRLETESLIGFFINTLVLRTDLSGEPSFAELLRRVQAVTLEAYAHQDLPFEKLVEELAPDRSLGHTPLFQVMFVLQNAPTGVLDLPGLTFAPFATSATTAKFDLTLNLAESAGGLSTALVYNRELFDDSTAARMIEHWEILLRAIAAGGDRRVDELPWMSAAETGQVLVEWSRIREAQRGLRPIHERFAEQAVRLPEAPAVRFEDRLLTYGELDQRANRLARWLRRSGIGPEDCVGIYAERSLEVITALLAVLKAGAAYLPLDPGLPAERLAWMIAQARAGVVLTQGELATRLPESGLRVLRLDADAGVWETGNASSLALEVAPENLAYVIYTSGSTGQPKGVAVEHRQLAHYVEGALEHLGLGDCASFATVSTFAADLGHTAVFPALVSGACLHVIARERAGDGEAFAEYFERHGVDCLKIVPSHLAALQTVRSPERGLPRRRLVLGGEAASLAWVQELQSRAPECRIFNHYGPTETTVGALTHPVAGVWSGGSTGNVPLGRPLPGAEVYILDRRLQPVPAGVPGELHIGGAGLARGYLHRPELTVERFVPDPFGSSGGRLYQTGDLARFLADGSLEFLGRIDQQVKIRGFRIELQEIEATLARHPAVAEALVVARQEAGGDKRLVAYVVPAQDSGAVASAADLRGFLRSQLPDYMVPAAFVSLASLPLTANGKVDRRALPAPEEPGRGEDDGVRPRTAAEELMVGLWAEVLRVENVGVHDDFFDLGGHSLLATQLIARVRNAFAVELPLRALFEKPTVAALTARVEELKHEGAGVSAPPIERTRRDRELPLSFAQQRLWFLHLLEPESSAYNVPISIRLQGRLDPAVLELSLAEVVRRHEALRTRFVAVEGRAVQRIEPGAALRLPVVDLAGLPVSLLEAEVGRLNAEEAWRPFDLTAIPLLRGALLRLSAQEHVILLSTHHIVSDGGSMENLVRELLTIYPAFQGGRPSPLRELPLQYADFATWQRALLEGEVLEQQLRYWRQQLAGAPELLEVPTDRPRPAELSARGGRSVRLLPAPLSLALRAFSRREGTTLFMTLLAAYQVLISHFSGREDILIGSPVSGRGRAEIEHLIGCFVNLLPLRAHLSGDLGFHEHLHRVRQMTLDAHAHQDLPFELLVERLRPQRTLGYNPLVQVTFTFQEAARERVVVPGLTLSAVPLESDQNTIQFDLTLNMGQEGDRLVASFAYSADLYGPETMDRLLSCFEGLLQAVVERPQARLNELRQVVAEAEREWWAARKQGLQSARSQKLGKLKRRGSTATAVAAADLTQVGASPEIEDRADSI